MDAPRTQGELLERARALAGERLGQVAAQLAVQVPPDLRRAKGWPGMLIERALGATAKSRAAPDFEALGVELKTLPVDARGRPLETTFVCHIPLADMARVEWSQSRVLRKLQKVLWVPVEGTRTTPVADRRIGTALLWTPSEQEEQDLRFDWEELAGMIGGGRIEDVTGHLGRYLQVRPKARDGSARRRAEAEGGASIMALPRGFYLRTSFTGRILKRHFALPE